MGAFRRCRRIIIPDDLEKALSKHKGTKDYFLSLNKSLKKVMLYTVTSAKRPETRHKRIEKLVEALKNGTGIH